MAQASIHAADPPGGTRPDGSAGAPDSAAVADPDGEDTLVTARPPAPVADRADPLAPRRARSSGS